MCGGRGGRRSVAHTSSDATGWPLGTLAKGGGGGGRGSGGRERGGGVSVRNTSMTGSTGRRGWGRDGGGGRRSVAHTSLVI